MLAAILLFFSVQVFAAEAPPGAAPETPPEAPKEIILNVHAKKKLTQSSSSVSSSQIDKSDIEMLPQGDNIKLPKLMATTTPGIVSGPFGQSYIRGNHANIQYQIDGVQLPDSPSNTFGDAFTPRNIDHMEVITGGIPAEFGERLGGVVNIVTKTGSETPGGTLEFDYGSYNTSSPSLIYSGSNSNGDVHYFLSAGYTRTDRGLDTPQPDSTSNITKGGWAAVHDFSWGTNEFAKIDWQVNNSNKVSFVLFNSYTSYQIPNFPSNFSSQDPYFQQNYQDQFGNGPVNWVPSTTDDTQQSMDSYLQIVWKHNLSDTSFVQIAPYYKYSYIGVKNDSANDLASSFVGPNQIAGATPSTFTESRPVNNIGLKGDYSERFISGDGTTSAGHLLKLGFQGQFSQATGGISATTTQPVSIGVAPSFSSSSDFAAETGYFESIYIQDDWTISKNWILNAGVRGDITQFMFSNASPSDGLIQPRIGLNWLPNETLKLHVFYGKLFQPAPVENLRDTFVNLGSASSLTGFDVKAEKDDYYEVGISQLLADHVVSVNTYYKSATNMLDDTQLLNTSIAQPYNFAQGFAYGTELSIKGTLSAHWFDFFNYAYEIAKGNGLSGGLFTNTTPSTDWQYLDHVQISTANLGVTYKPSTKFFTTLQSLYGSGLRTGPGNFTNLPGHLTFDATAGYSFHGESWFERFKVSVDILNILNNAYPITISNGFNGNHYSAGSEVIVHLSKDI